MNDVDGQRVTGGGGVGTAAAGEGAAGDGGDGGGDGGGSGGGDAAVGPTGGFLASAKKLGPVVGALAVLSVTLPGALGTALLVFVTASAGSPSNFYDPEKPGYHALLGTWETTLAVRAPEWPEDATYPEQIAAARLEAAEAGGAAGSDPAVGGLSEPIVEAVAVEFGDEELLRFAIEPEGGSGAERVDAVRVVPLRLEPPPDVDRDEWEPYGVVVVSPGQRSLRVEPTLAYSGALPALSLELERGEGDAGADRLRGESRGAGLAVAAGPEGEAREAGAGGDGAVSFTAERRVSPVQQLTLSLGVPMAALVVALVFAAATGSAVLPTYALSFAVGVFFGPWYGSAIALAGVTGGSMVGYTWGAALARKRVSAVIDENPRAHVVRAAILGKPLLQETFMVILLRFPPNSPFALTNLVMSSVGVRLVPYFLGTLIGIAPRTLLAVFIGVGVGSLADAQTAGGTVRVIVGMVVSITVFVLAYRLLSKWAREALAAETGAASGEAKGIAGV